MVGVVQIVVSLLPAIIAFVFFRDQLNLPNIDFGKLPIDPLQIAISAGVLLGGFLLFTGLLVAIGASVPTAKEANQFFGFAIGSMFIPLYALMAVITDPSQLLVKVFSYFPTTAPVTLLLRNAAGNLRPVEGLVGIIILLLTSSIALAVAIRAFKYGTLEYSRKLSFRELFAWR